MPALFEAGKGNMTDAEFYFRVGVVIFWVALVVWVACKTWKGN